MSNLAEKPASYPNWTLVSSHGLVLLFVATHPETTIRTVAEVLQITERRVCDLIRDLSEADLLMVERVGRRNRYRLNEDAHFRHPAMANIPFRDFVALFKKYRSTRELIDEPVATAAP